MPGNRHIALQLSALPLLIILDLHFCCANPFQSIYTLPRAPDYFLSESEHCASMTSLKGVTYNGVPIVWQQCYLPLYLNPYTVSTGSVEDHVVSKVFSTLAALPCLAAG